MAGALARPGRLRPAAWAGHPPGPPGAAGAPPRPVPLLAAGPGPGLAGHPRRAVPRARRSAGLDPTGGLHDPNAAWSYPAAKGRVFGDAVHVLLDRVARLPICFLLSPTNRNDLPFAYPLLWFARVVLALPIRVVRADGASWGLALVRWIVTVLRARPITPFNRKKQPLARVRHLVWYRLSDAKRAIIERCFAAAKRYCPLDTSYALDGQAVLLQVTLTFCAILVVALPAHQAGAPQLRLSPTRVLAHYQPIEAPL